MSSGPDNNGCVTKHSCSCSWRPRCRFCRGACLACFARAASVVTFPGSGVAQTVLWLSAWLTVECVAPACTISLAVVLGDLTGWAPHTGCVCHYLGLYGGNRENITVENIRSRVFLLVTPVILILLLMIMQLTNNNQN